MQTTRFILLVTVLLIWSYKSVRAENVIISEIMADNENILQDGHGNYSDWIEIHNPHPIDIDLTGFFLTDSRSDLRKWNFPNKTIIGSNEHLIVFASGQEDDSPCTARPYVGLKQAEGRHERSRKSSRRNAPTIRGGIWPVWL